jgi:pyruvate formate lyase activating enzyme
VRICPRSAQIRHGGQRVFLRSRCTLCGLCVKVCVTGALQWNGRKTNVKDVVAEALFDRDYYANTGGGVTLSGGEPLLQPEFTRALLAALRQEGIHTALETSAYVPWATLAETLPLVDLYMVDIKHLDAEVHRSATGVSNQRILGNIRRLAKTGKPVIFRIPVVPGVNDSPEMIEEIAGFIRSLGELRDDHGEGLSLELLPFHHLASDKYASLDLEYKAAGLQSPSKARMAELGDTAQRARVTVRVR